MEVESPKTYQTQKKSVSSNDQPQQQVNVQSTFDPTKVNIHPIPRAAAGNIQIPTTAQPFQIPQQVIPANQVVPMEQKIPMPSTQTPLDVETPIVLNAPKISVTPEVEENASIIKKVDNYKDSSKKLVLKKINAKAPTDDLIFSLQNLSIMLKTGLAIEDALDVISTQSQSKTLRDVFSNIIKDINAGTTLANSMRKYPQIFTPFITSIVDAGEQGGNLENNLTYLADYIKKNYQLHKKIRAAMFYPLLILFMTFIEIVGVIFFVLPQLDTFFSAVPNKSGLTLVVLSVGNFVRHNALLMFCIILATFLFSFLFFKTKPGAYVKDVLKLQTPILKKLTVSIVLSNFSRTFGTLLQSGIPVYDSLVLSRETISNKIYEAALMKAEKKVLGGSGIADSLEEHPRLFPSIFTKMLDVGEKAGALESNLLSMHEYYSSQAEELSNNFAVLIEPILLIFIGIVVGILAISIIVPLYSVVSGLHA